MADQSDLVMPQTGAVVLDADLQPVTSSDNDLFVTDLNLTAQQVSARQSSARQSGIEGSKRQLQGQVGNTATSQ